MADRDRSLEVSHDLRSREEGIKAPSYADVRDLAVQFELRFACRVSFRLDPEDVFERWKRPRIWLRAGAYYFAKKERATRYAAHAYGGNSGTKAMSAAMLASLLDLWNACEGDAEVDPEIVA